MKIKILIILMFFSSFKMWAQEQNIDIHKVDVVEQFVPKVHGPLFVAKHNANDIFCSYNTFFSCYRCRRI